MAETGSFSNPRRIRMVCRIRFVDISPAMLPPSTPSLLQPQAQRSNVKYGRPCGIYRPERHVLTENSPRESDDRKRSEQSVLRMVRTRLESLCHAIASLVPMVLSQAMAEVWNVSVGCSIMKAQQRNWLVNHESGTA